MNKLSVYTLLEDILKKQLATYVYCRSLMAFTYVGWLS